MVAFGGQPGAFLLRDFRGTAAQAAGAVQRGPNGEQSFLRVFGRSAGFCNDGFPKLRSRPQDPRLAGVLISLAGVLISLAGVLISLAGVFIGDGKHLLFF